MQFEETFKYIGEVGLYQLLLFSLAGLSEFMGPEAIGMNFIGYNMDHWCKIPELQGYSHKQQKYISIPTEDYQGAARYSRCRMFPFNYSSYTAEDLLNWNRTAAEMLVNRSDYVRCNKWMYDQSVMVTTITSRVCQTFKLAS